MRRFGKLIFVIICVCLLTTTVFAQTVATTVSTRAIVSANGQATVTMTVNILLDNPSSGLTFPLPAAAQNVAMNGSSIRTYSSAYDKNVVLADLSAYDGYTGKYQLVFSYTLEDVLRTELKEKREESLLLLELPLLCGFEYPVEKMDFSVTMPGDLTTEKISFTSGVMQTGIESIIKYSMGGQRVDGVVNQTLQDRETVTLVMQVKEEMFPGKLVIPREGNPEIVPMAIFAALALLYWIIFMRTLPVIRHRRTTLIEGVTAGELGSRLTAAGADLTMMVFSWAQLGYVRIHTDRYGRVIVEKRMDMGNERTEFERRCFASLFSRGDAVDATGMRYAKLCRHVSEFIPGIREMYTKRSGNIVIFRCLFCVVSIFCGICYGKNLIPEGWLQTLVVIVLATLGAITAWAIQDGMYKLHVRGKIPLYVSSACSVLWMVLGIVSGVWIIALVTVLGQVLAGLAAAYGGRRSDLGRYNASEILGVRHYLKTVKSDELERLIDQNPDYFFDMLPYAIALGVDTPFARAFGSRAIPECGYLNVRTHDERTAKEWAYLVRKMADKMDNKQRKLELEKWIPVSLAGGDTRPENGSRRRSSSGNTRRTASRQNPQRRRSDSRRRR